MSSPLPFGLSVEKESKVQRPLNPNEANRRLATMNSHEVLAPVQLLLRLQNHHHHTQATTLQTLQTSLAMDPEEKKQVQSIIDRFKGHFLTDGGEIGGSINSSSSEFAMNIIAHIVREYESGSDAYETETTSHWFIGTDMRQYLFDISLLNAVGYWCAVVVCKLSVFPVYLYISLAIHLLDSKVPPPPEAQYPYPNQYPYPYPYQYPNPPENLEQYFGHKRADAAAILGVSVSTFKRMCKEQGINPWPYPYRKGSSGSVSRPPDQHGERNTSTARKTPSHNVQTGIEGVPVGQNQEANEFRRDFMEHSIALNTENIIAVYSENEAARGSSKWAFQLESQTMQSTTHPYRNDLVFSQPQTASKEVPNENMGSLQDRRDLLASQEVAPQQEPLLEGHVFGFGNWTVGSCSDLAPTQPMHTFSHATGSSENLKNLLASVEEHLMEGNVCGSSMSDPALSQPMRTIHHTMATIPHMMPLPTERQDTGSVKIKATYEDTNIKFQFPLTSGIKELKEVMSKILERKLGSFKVEYKDVDGEWILMGLDEHVREYLQLLLGNKVTTELKVQDKVPNTTNFCDNCRCNNRRSVKRKKP